VNSEYTDGSQAPSKVPLALVKGKGRTLVIAPLQAYQPPQRRSGTWRAQSSVAHTFPTVAGTHLPTPKGWRVESAQAHGAKSNWPTIAT